MNNCRMCGSPDLIHLGALGNLDHFRCRDCGWDGSSPSEDDQGVPDEREEDMTGEDAEMDQDEPWDGFNSDAEADADTLASAGMGTDEDYGMFHDSFEDNFFHDDDNDFHDHDD